MFGLRNENGLPTNDSLALVVYAKPGKRVMIGVLFTSETANSLFLLKVLKSLHLLCCSTAVFRWSI